VSPVSSAAKIKSMDKPARALDFFLIINHNFILKKKFFKKERRCKQ
jgi:hypothetical protein